MLLGWKNQYCEIGCTTKSNPHIQCNLYQITNDIFHITRTKKKIHNLYGNTKGPKQPKQSLERRMEQEESTYLISVYTTKVQSSRQYGTGKNKQTNKKTEVQANVTR